MSNLIIKPQEGIFNLHRVGTEKGPYFFCCSKTNHQYIGDIILAQLFVHNKC